MLRLIILTIAILGLFFNSIKAKQGYGPGEQDWGYIDVREGAHMFYWLHYTTATPNYVERPLVIWLQGGPGASSTGIGNFQEIGPLDEYEHERNSTWIKDVNVLFIDNPVGSGFSYVDDKDKLTNSVDKITIDLITFMKTFLEKHAEFKHVPLHIFGESYGGRMAPHFALELYYAIQRNELSANLTSVVLVSPAVSLEEVNVAYAPYLLNMGVVDDDGYNEIMKAAIEAKKLFDAKKWTEARLQWNNVTSTIIRKSGNIDLLNVVRPIEISKISDDAVTKLMQEKVHERLAIPFGVKWVTVNSTAYDPLSVDMIMPSIDTVSELLDKTDLQVGVVAGQFDLTIPLPATVNWINKMTWNYKNEYVEAPRSLININGILEGYEKTARKFSMFWIYRAGHMVPADNPVAMKYILRKFTNYG